MANLLRQQSLAKEVILTSFSAAPVVKIRATVAGLTSTQEIERSFSLIRVDTVTVKRQHVELDGYRRYLVRRGDVLAPFAAKEPVHVQLEVDANLTPAQVVAAADALFFPDLSAALATLSPEAREVIPGSVDERKPPPASPDTSCDCSQRGTPACQGRLVRQGISQPKIVHADDPRMPPAAPQGTITHTSAALHIDRTGKVTSIWMLHAPSRAFAEATFTSLHSSSFTPALCHGAPVDTYIVVDQQFKVF